MKRWWAALLAAGMMTTTVLAVVGPDSIWQNQVVDRSRLRSAHGALTAWDNVPLGTRCPWILIHGLHQSNESADGMMPSDARQLWELPMTNWQAIYREEFGRELLADVKPFLYTYNSERDDDATAADLNALIEGNHELTGANARLVFVAHSKGGCIAYNYWVNFGERKFLRGVTLGSPLVGTIAADESAMRTAAERVYPVLGDKLMRVIERGINFDTPGVEWLRQRSPGLMRLHDTRPLDSTWRLYAGEIRPASSNVITRNLRLALLADAVFIGRLGNEGDFYLPLCAGLVKTAGGGENDGLVPVVSAHAQGFARGAMVRRLSDCNHYELLQGRQGDLEVHRQVLYDLLTFIPGETGDILVSEMWLPDGLTIDLPRLVDSRLVDARIVWADKNGSLWVADKGGAQARRLPLGGRYSWPNWAGDDIITERDGDVVRIEASGQTVQLTASGDQALPTYMNGRLVWLNRGELWSRADTGAANAVIAEPLTLANPPVVYADKIYFVQGNDLYWIGADQRQAKLTDAKRVMRDMAVTFRVGDFLLGVTEDGQTKAILGGWLGLSEWALPASVKASRQWLSQVTMLDIDDVSGELYVVANGHVRYVDYSVLANYAPDWAKELTAATLEQRVATLPAPTLDELAPSLGAAVWLDVK